MNFNWLSELHGELSHVSYSLSKLELLFQAIVAIFVSAPKVKRVCFHGASSINSQKREGKLFVKTQMGFDNRPFHGS